MAPTTHLRPNTEGPQRLTSDQTPRGPRPSSGGPNIKKAPNDSPPSPWPQSFGPFLLIVLLFLEREKPWYRG